MSGGRAGSSHREGPLDLDRGLDAAGFVRREGDKGRVQREFANLVDEYVDGVRSALGGRGLDSIYLYGSIPRGTARAGRSDLDGQVLLDREPTEADRVTLDLLATDLAAGHPEVSAVEVLLHSRAQMTDPALRCDEGFHIRVLCTPFWGPDAGAVVAPHLPDLELARAVQGDWRAAVARYRSAARQLADVPWDDPRALTHQRSVGRRLTRLAFTWLMPRWGGWTSDPSTVLAVVRGLEPTWAPSVTEAVALGWGRTDVDGPASRHRARVAETLLGDFTDRLVRRGEDLGA